MDESAGEEEGDGVDGRVECECECEHEHEHESEWRGQCEAEQ